MQVPVCLQGLVVLVLTHSQLLSSLPHTNLTLNPGRGASNTNKQPPPAHASAKGGPVATLFSVIRNGLASLIKL